MNGICPVARSCALMWLYICHRETTLYKFRGGERSYLAAPFQKYPRRLEFMWKLIPQETSKWMYIGQAGIWSALAGQCKYDKLSVANISVLRHEEEIVAFHLRGTENKTCCSVCVCVCARVCYRQACTTWMCVDRACLKHFNPTKCLWLKYTGLLLKLSRCYTQRNVPIIWNLDDIECVVPIEKCAFT